MDRRTVGIPVAIGIGSNLGDRLAHIEAAFHGLGAGVFKQRCSPVYVSDPMYVEDQPPFLNACCVGETRLAAGDLLRLLQALERNAGRRAGGPRFGPRELDLDLLLYGERVIEEPGLRVPHPRMTERAFVLEPLARLAGHWRHPETGQSIAEIAAALPAAGLRVYAFPPDSTRGDR